MASSIQLLRSTNPQERPFAGNLLEGQPAANLHSSEPGLFFKTTDGSVVKFGPAAITSDGSPPNSTPQGSAGNSVGELWLDKSVDPAVLKVYDGTQWVDAGSGGGGGETGSFLRWIYTAAGGETSLSGDSGGVLLDYTPGLEEVFINGSLITRGTAYSAVNGTSITNLAPLTAGDIVTVLSMNPLETVILPGQVTLLRWTISATQGQTVLSGIDPASQQLAYTAGFEEVYVNGAFLRRNVDYTASDGETITLTTPLTLNDEVTVMAWSTFEVGDLSIRDDNVAADADIQATKLAFTQLGTGAVQRPVQSKLQDVISVKDFGATGSGTTDDTQYLQNLADYVDTAKLPYMFFPTNQENYLVTSPIYFNQPGVKVFGNKGPSYERGGGKYGNILVGGSALYGIDFGNSSTSVFNPADSWAIANIGFKQAQGIAAKTKIGVAFTRQNNGPDRGAIVREISATGMYAGVYIKALESPNTISLATLVVENCDLSNNRYGIYSDGRVYGLRFCGNQSEQNNNGAVNNALGGAVHGKFMGPITINDNMLEGQPDAINILSDAGSIRLESKGNYFETNNTNSSSFVYQLGSISGTKNTAIIGPNFYSGVNTPPDYLRVTGAGDWEVWMNDPYPVTFDNLAGSVLYGSSIFGRRTDFYRVRRVNMSVKAPEIYVEDGLNTYDVNGDWLHVKYNSGLQVDTPLGVQYVQDVTTATSIPLAVTAGDLVVINLMVLCKDVMATTFTGQILTPADNFNFSLGPSRLAECSLGRWVLVSIPMRMASTLSSFKFRVAASGGSYTCLLAGISAKNYGAFSNDGSSVVDVSPVAPKFN